MLSTDELASIRADSAEAFPDTCDILQPSTSPDGMGGVTRTYISRAAAVPCRMSPAGTASSEQEVAVRPRLESRWTLTIAYDSVLEGTDIVRYPATTGILFEVEDSNDGMSWELVRRVTLVELT